MLPIQRIVRQIRESLSEENIRVRLDADVLFKLSLRAKMNNQSREELAEAILTDAILDIEDDELRLAWKQLTEREQQVAALACLGLTYKDIANCLSIGRSTVHTHLSRIYQKMGVEGKQHLRSLLVKWDFSAYRNLCK